MWISVLVVAATLSACVADNQPQQSAFAGLRGAVEPRLAASGIRIARLEHELELLDHNIDKASEVDPRGFIEEMHGVLDDHEEPKCSPTHVQCGWQSRECVSFLFVCDGYKDCHNGWDEDEHTCDHGGMVAGNVFTGTATWSSCLPLREHPVSMKITTVATPKIFPARLFVRAEISGDIIRGSQQIHREGDFKGYYTFGQRRLVLAPIHDDIHSYLHYGIVCHFQRDLERAHCQLLNEMSLAKCADVHIVMEHHDTHHQEHHHEEHHTLFEQHYDDGKHGHHVEHHGQGDHVEHHGRGHHVQHHGQGDHVEHHGHGDHVQHH